MQLPNILWQNPSSENVESLARLIEAHLPHEDKHVLCCYENLLSMIPDGRKWALVHNHDMCHLRVASMYHHSANNCRSQPRRWRKSYSSYMNKHNCHKYWFIFKLHDIVRINKLRNITTMVVYASIAPGSQYEAAWSIHSISSRKKTLD